LYKKCPEQELSLGQKIAMLELIRTISLRYIFGEKSDVRSGYSSPDTQIRVISKPIKVCPNVRKENEILYR
ncbi:MAG: hypothetical protein MI717_08785, partial [Spirochaetales bacterium]|nr:hypothetical protein [Spirochaetales bacterium]